jgi:hypothetical protein
MLSPGRRRAYVESGGLLGYGPDLRAIAARAAVYVDKIIKGAAPSDRSCAADPMSRGRDRLRRSPGLEEA